MAKSGGHVNGTFTLELDEAEQDFLVKHCLEHGLSNVHALEDIVEYAIAILGESTTIEFGPFRDDDGKDRSEFKLAIVFPKSGCIAVSEQLDKDYITGCVAAAVTRACNNVYYLRQKEANQDVMEREDTGMGAGEPPFPVN